MNCYNKLEDIIYTQKKCVTVANLCYIFNIHIDEAQRLVSDFVDKATKDGKELDITYVLSGYKNEDGDEIKLQRFIIAKEDELEEAKKYFTEISSSQIRSLSLKGCDQQPNVYDKETSIISTNDELLRNQKVSRIINSSISLRQDLIKKFNYQNGFLDESQTVKEVVKDVKNEESKKEKSSNTKGTNNSKKMVNYFTKVNSKTNDKEPQQINEEKETEEPKMFESDEEIEYDNEDLIPEKEKNVSEKESRKSEKRKRIRVFNGSDSESSQHVNDFNDNEEPKQKIAKIADEQMQTEIIDEVFKDEDGYTVTNKVKKMVKVKKRPSESDDLENEENIRHSKEIKTSQNMNDLSRKHSKKVVGKSDEDEKPKKRSEESENKSKTKNKAIPKGQVAITSFFKPVMK